MPTSLSASSRSLRPSVSIVIFHHIPYSFTFSLEKLSLHSSRKGRHGLDAIFFVKACRSLKPCTSLMQNVSLRVPTRNFRDFSPFGVCPSNKHYPSAWCAYATIAVGKDFDIFAIGAISVNHFHNLSKMVN
jgi:hypothetical protein